VAIAWGDVGMAIAEIPRCVVGDRRLVLCARTEHRSHWRAAAGDGHFRQTSKSRFSLWSSWDTG